MKWDTTAIHRRLLWVFVAFAVAAMAGCGIKPSSLERPKADNGKVFPGTYPDADTLR